MLLVHLEIIDTTYRSMIFETHLFSLYSHLCIYIATHLHMVYLDCLQVVLDSNSRCAWKWRSTKYRDTLRGHNQVSLEMNLEAVIKQDWRYTRTLQMCVLGGRNRASLETDMQGVIERVWRYNWSPWSSELRDALRDCDWASFETHLEAMIVRSCRLWSSESGDTLAGRDGAS